MFRHFMLVATVGLALAPVARASDAPPRDVETKIQQAAQKSCNDDLDADRFEQWSSVEQCVADKSAKMERAYSANHASQAAAGPHAH